MSVPCLIVLMDVRVAPRLLLSSQNTHADPHKETPRNAVCTVCVCVRASVCLLVFCCAGCSCLTAERGSLKIAAAQSSQRKALHQDSRGLTITPFHTQTRTHT